MQILRYFSDGAWLPHQLGFQSNSEEVVHVDSTAEYRIILDRKREGVCDGIGYINVEGAKLLWAAYTGFSRGLSSQTMEQREKRGGICWLSEIELWKKQGLLPENFNWTDYATHL